MNIVSLVGRLTRDPEIFGEGNGKRAKYTLAVDRQFKRDGQPTADFINCVVFGKGAEFAEKWLHQGMRIGVNGRLQTGSYDGKDGHKVYFTNVVVDVQEFCESKSVTPLPKEEAEEPKFTNVPEGTDEELPFV